MKALTICQPYAEMIVRGDKRVENRTWPTKYRGPLYIHAGKNKQWLDDGDLENFPNMAFGAVIATVNLVDCIHIDAIPSVHLDKKYPWLRNHEHVSGPWCWILDRVTPIGPWPYRGAQGLFEIEDLDRVANGELGVAS